MNRNFVIAIAAIVVVAVFAGLIFTMVNQAPEVDGSQTANEPVEQQELPAGPADEPAETTN